MPRMSCALNMIRRKLVAISSGKVLPVNMEISPTSTSSGREQRSCKVRLGEAVTALDAETTEGARTPASTGSGGDGACVVVTGVGGDGGAGDAGGAAVGCAAADCPAATCVGQPSCKVRRRWRAVFFQ
jgi:hypothetical protein